MVIDTTIKKGYKQTDLGVIPEDWKIGKLGDFVKITSGESPSKFIFKTSGIPYYKVEQLNNSEKYQKETPYYIESNNTIPKGSIIFPKRGASVLLNKVRILIEDSYMDTNLMTLTLSGGLYSEFVYYMLTHIELWRIADTTSIPQINNKHINPILITFPPSEEQIAIATVLSDTDTLIEHLEKLIAKKKAIKQGTMQQLLTGKKRLPGFSGEWKVKKLGEIGETYGGLSGKKKSDFDGGKYPYIPFMNIMSNPVIDLQYFDYVNIRGDEKQNKAIKGDLFFNGSSETPEEVGMCSVLQGNIPNLYLNSFCFGFRLNKDLKTDGIYLSYFFRSPMGRQLIFSLAQGATRYNLSKTNFMKLEIPYPDPAEQTAIANVLIDMDAEIEKLESQLAKYQNIKQGMMQQLLTGKMRLL